MYAEVAGTMSTPARARIILLAAIVSIAWVVGGPAVARAQDDWGDDADLPIEIHGFVEYAAGGRIVDDPTQRDDVLLNEPRLRLNLAHYRDRAELQFKGDFLADGVSNETVVDIRRAAVLLRAAGWIDLTAGRQVLTWGTGDLLFLNDRFAKDFVAFFIGRDDEFLKAPSNSFKATLYANAANLDVVWTPVFTPDNYLTGERLSFYSPSKPGRTGASEMGGPLAPRPPDKTWENGELAARAFRNIKGYELAAYGYVGFWNQPTAMDTATMTPAFAELAVYGASIRGNLVGGIGNLEGAYYDAYENRDGTKSTMPNSQVRGLAGYERELMSNLTAGLQYYAERILQYETLVANAPRPESIPEEVRHLVSLRLNQRLMQQTLSLSLFGYYSPNERDGYIRPIITRNVSDAVTVAAGANIFWGDDSTFFGQLADNTNVYVRARYSF